MGKKGDESGVDKELSTIDITDLKVKDMTKSKGEEGHALIIDVGSSKIHLNFAHKFELEMWYEIL